MDSYPKLVLECGLHWIANAFSCSIIMCVIMMMCSIIGCAVQTATEKAEWGYGAENGPEVWGQLKPGIHSLRGREASIPY